MPEQWRERSHQAFRFWHQLLTTWDEAPGASGQYGALIAYLNEKETWSGLATAHLPFGTDLVLRLSTSAAEHRAGRLIQFLILE